MFTRLLVGIDGSPASEIALGTAMELGRRFDTTIVLAAITDLRAIQAPLMSGAPMLGGDLPAALPAMESLQAVLAERGEKLLADAGKKVRGAGLSAETVQTSGIVADMLLSLAEETEALVVGRRGESQGDNIGAETGRIIRRSPRPVLVAGTAVSACLRPVVAYDGGETSGNALTLAARYAEAAKVPVEVIHASDDPAEGDELLGRAGAYLSGLGIDFSMKLLPGKTVEAVKAHVERGGFDLLLVGAHGGRRRRSWSIGSHADKLVRATSVPVIVVR